ncbi:MAG TPA: hypothetical protein ENK13_00505 [Thermopetrobacter sp.]|nr:hypothetical protein [Thermopetrobacter sp.]
MTRDDGRSSPEPAAAGRETRSARRSGASAILCRLGLAGALLGLALPWLTALWLGFDVFSQFTVHFLIIAAACAVGLLVPRRGPAVAIALVVAGGLAIGGWAMLHRSGGFPATAAPGTVRVMTFNTWTRNEDVTAIAAEVRRQKPDIVGMMEVVPAKRRLLDLLRADYPYLTHCLDKQHCYLALFSRWPMEKVAARSLWEGPPYLHVVVRTPTGPVHVFAVHTLRFPWLGSQLKQVKALGRLLRRVKGPKIVMGDFNATPFSVMLHTFVRRSGLRRQTWLPTWPAWAGPLPQLAIDHVFISPELERVAGPWIGDAAGSDHFPVVIEVRPRGGAAGRRQGR